MLIRTDTATGIFSFTSTGIFLAPLQVTAPTLAANNLITQLGNNVIRMKESAGTTGIAILHRRDTSGYYILLTATDDADGSVTFARPLSILLADGTVTSNTV